MPSASVGIACANKIPSSPMISLISFRTSFGFLFCLLKIEGFVVTPSIGYRSHNLLIASIFASSINNFIFLISYNVCSLLPIISSCVFLLSTLKNAEYPATRTMRSVCFSGCFCASSNVSLETILYCT